MECAEGVLVAERYRLVRKLGAGGMGSVWLAHDVALDSACALKLIDAEKSQSEEVRLRFEREAKAAAQLRGSHVVDVFDHGEWEDILYIAMEYLEGEDLGARLERVKAMSAEDTHRIVAHVARALTRAHANGIVHRDLKPENIFLVPSDEGEVAKVLDFGIAKHDAYSLQDKATRTGSFLGTPYYVSPEQARGRSTDHRSDLWSLGIIAFQCLTGRPPFESDALGELMGLILYEDLPIPTLKNPALPPAIDAWWERAAARDREQRFQSAKELSDALGVALGVSNVVSVQSTPPKRSTADATGPQLAHKALSPPLIPRVRSSDAALLADALAADRADTTDVPVSRTRRSGRVLDALRGHGRRRWVVASAVTGGVVLGVLLTLMLVGDDASPSVTHAAASPPASVEVVRPSSSADGASARLPPVIPLEALPISDEDEAQQQESNNEDEAQSRSSSKRRRAAPAPPPPSQRRRGPDYGI